MEECAPQNGFSIHFVTFSSALVYSVVWKQSLGRRVQAIFNLEWRHREAATGMAAKDILVSDPSLVKEVWCHI